MKSSNLDPLKSRCRPSSNNLPSPVRADGDGDGDDEPDYMKMTFDEAPAAPESSLQRRQREKREAERRARVKSKAELAEEEEARREAALSRSLLDDASARKSKGFAMMAKMGFQGGALGAKEKTADKSAGRPGPSPDGKTAEDDDDDDDGSGLPQDTSGGQHEEDADATKRPGGQSGRMMEPIRISIKDGREGIGLESERKRKLREAAEQAGVAAKRARADQGEYRERMRREREDARLDGLVRAAQKVAERVDEEKAEESESGRPVSSRPLKAIPVVWRGLVRARETAERDRRMRHDLEQGLSRLPTYEDDDHLDADDKVALGRDASGAARTVYATADDLEDEDQELDVFEALTAEERLARLVAYLREGHNYCFWCKLAYPDADMDGCPGLTEEDHD